MEDIHFSPEETRRLFKRFIRLDSDMSGGLDMHEVFKLQRVSDNPLAHRFLEIFDKDKDGIVDFSEFMEGMAVFSRPGYSEKKLKFLFDIYDVNNDGFLSNGDLFKALKLMVGENLDDASLQQVVDKTMRDCDRDCDGKLNFHEFKDYVEKSNRDIIDKLTIQALL